jgi:hypothetical protein
LSSGTCANKVAVEAPFINGFFRGEHLDVQRLRATDGDVKRRDDHAGDDGGDIVGSRVPFEAALMGAEYVGARSDLWGVDVV